MSYTDATFKAALAQFMGVDPAGANFLAVYPTLVRGAELRLYRDLDLVSTQTTAEVTIDAYSTDGDDAVLTLDANLLVLGGKVLT